MFSIIFLSASLQEASERLVRVRASRNKRLRIQAATRRQAGRQARTHARARARALSLSHTTHTHTHTKHLSKRWTIRLEMIKSNRHCNRRHASNSLCNRHHTHVSKSYPRIPTKRRGFDLCSVTTWAFKACACLSYSNKHT
jgi:hypothetical protein